MIIGIGTDIIEIQRIKQAIQTRPKLGERLFTPGELDYCGKKGNPFASLAARFAAKEAVAKALGTGIDGFKWVDIEVINDEKGKPIIRLYNQVRIKAQELGITRIEISLSHCKEYAVATVCCWGDGTDVFSY